MNKEDILFLGDLLCDYNISNISEEKRVYYDLFREKIFALVEQIHIQETHLKYVDKISEIEKQQKELNKKYKEGK